MTEKAWSREQETLLIRQGAGTTGETETTPSLTSAPAISDRRPLDSHRRWHVRYRRRPWRWTSVAGTPGGGRRGRGGLDNLLTLRALAVAVGIVVSWITALSLCHGYEKRFLGTATEEYRAVVRAATSLFCLVAFVSFAAPIKISRYTVLIVLPTLLIGGLLGRHALRRSLVPPPDPRARRGDAPSSSATSSSVGPLIREIQPGAGAGHGHRRGVRLRPRHQP